MVAILSNSGKANPRAFAEERLGVLASNHKSAGNDAAALRCEITVPEGSHGGGCDHPTPTLITLSRKTAPRPFKPRGTNNQPLPVPTRSVVVEAPDAVTLRQRTVKTTSFGTAGMHCAAVSLLKRTARLSDILRHMGHGNSGQDPDWVPPSDAEILAAYYRRMMAKQRWTKAQAALTSIRAMQGGLLGALGGGAAQKAKAFPAFGAIPGAEPKPPPPPPPPPPRPVTPEDPDSPRSHTPTPFVVVKPRRASITELTSGARAKAQASAMMGRMPKEKDVRRMLRELAGDWFVVFVDTKFDMILAAMSGECTSKVFAAVGGDGTLYFGTDRASMPSSDDDGGCRVSQEYLFLRPVRAIVEPRVQTVHRPAELERRDDAVDDAIDDAGAFAAGVAGTPRGGGRLVVARGRSRGGASRRGQGAANRPRPWRHPRESPSAHCETTSSA